MLTQTPLILGTIAMAQLSLAGNLPLCSSAVQPCQCPEGTSYAASTTYGFFPVCAEEIADITAISFANLDYIGLNVTNTTGHGFDIGSSRTFSIDWDAALDPVTITEVLTSYNRYPRHTGYNMTWDMGNAPYHYKKQNGQEGLVAGFWSYEELRQVGHESFFLWSTWSCFGDVFDFQAFHELAFDNIAQILKKQGRSDGRVIGFTSTG